MLPGARGRKGASLRKQLRRGELWKNHVQASAVLAGTRGGPETGQRGAMNERRAELIRKDLDEGLTSGILNRPELIR